MEPSYTDDHAIERLRLELAEERPILVMEQTSAQADSTVRFDMHYALEMGVVLEGAMVR